MNIPRYWVYGLGLVLLAMVWVHGWVNGLQHEQDRAAVAAAVLEQSYRTLQHQVIERERIVTQYVDRVQVVHEKGDTIIKQVPVYVSTAADAHCVVPHGFVRLHDAAAQHLSDPGPAGASDAEPSGVALSAVASTVTDNYATCEANAEQLKALQDWVVVQSGIRSGGQGADAVGDPGAQK